MVAAMKKMRLEMNDPNPVSLRISLQQPSGGVAPPQSIRADQTIRRIV
ncbi:hypothetical protein COLO4_25007 [Corchorus olitorius]|uniref:Uncharacterized protein n=1 Tax=Corchorus olitorius TaxID=93759 RepID=A0A1R3I586_9ROSI|nr:hypothetical protein COLO4_25007 [Corchorus olitorius]